MATFGNISTQTTETLEQFYQDNMTLNSSMGAPTNDSDLEYHIKVTYITVPLLFVFFCLIAIAVNIRILLSVKWIRRPLSPTIFISLSLAVADTWTAILMALGFILNSFLPNGLSINIDNLCVLLTIEAFRLSGILVSTIHLLALAANHYFGILYPFRSMTTLTPTCLKTILFFIWAMPTVYIFAYFGSFENEAFRRSDCYIQRSFFLYYSKFRKIFSGLFFIPMLIMFGIYIHISIIVRRHQAKRRWFNRHSGRNESAAISESGTDTQKQIDRNMKAVWTSLLILSTYVICFMPAVVTFYLVCNDCYFKIDQVDKTTMLIISSITNFLLISKYLLNPLIYASRMQEIRLAIKQMDAEWRRVLCTFGHTDDEFELGVRSRVEGSQRFSLFSSSSRRRNIGVTSSHIQVRSGVDRPTQMCTEV